MKVWDIRDQSPKTPVSQLDCLVRTLHLFTDLITSVMVKLTVSSSSNKLLITVMAVNLSTSCHGGSEPYEFEYVD